jgi:hypothetical protein
LGVILGEAAQATDTDAVCTIVDLVDVSVVEFKWSRQEAWRRIKQVAETRGLPEFMFLVQPPGAKSALHWRTTNSIADADRRLVVKFEALQLLREEYPCTIGSKRGPKPKYDSPKARAALMAHWAKTNGPSEYQADDERFVLKFFASTKSGKEPTESLVREWVSKWRKEAERGQ